MPAILAALLGGLINIVGTMAGRVLVALGIGVVTYSGISVTLNWLKTEAIQSVSGLPAEVIGLIAYMKVGVCINIIFSAILIRAALNGLTGDTMKRWVLK